MWHDAIRIIAEDVPPSTSTPVGAIVAIIGAIALLVGALTGLLATLRRPNSNPPSPAPPAHEDVDHEAALERFLMRMGFDPNKIVTGDEWPNDAKFF